MGRVMVMNGSESLILYIINLRYLPRGEVSAADRYLEIISIEAIFKREGERKLDDITLGKSKCS